MPDITVQPSELDATPPSQTVEPAELNASQRSFYAPVAAAAARKYGIPEDLFVWQMGQESNFNPNARNTAPGTHATGIAQFEPGTSRERGLDPTDPVQSLDQAAAYMRELHDKTGDWGKAMQQYGTIGPQYPASVNAQAQKILSGLNGSLTVRPEELDAAPPTQASAPAAPQPPAQQYGIQPSQASFTDRVRQFIFGGPEGETSLGRAFPSLAGGKISDTATSDLPLVRFEQPLAPGANPAVYVAHGVNQFASSLTTPKNLAIMAATGGLGAIIPAAGYASVAGKIINTALSAYFADQMVKGSAEAVQAAYAAHKQGNDNEAARLLGYGSVAGLMGAAAGFHAASSAEGVLSTQVPRPAARPLKPEVVPREAEPQPEPLSKAPPQTITVDPAEVTATAPVSHETPPQSPPAASEAMMPPGAVSNDTGAPAPHAEVSSQHEAAHSLHQQAQPPRPTPADYAQPGALSGSDRTALPSQNVMPGDGTVPEVAQPPEWFTPKTITAESGGPAIRDEQGKTVVRGLRFQKTPGVPEVNPADGATYFNVANPAAFSPENSYSGETPAAGHWGGQHAITGEVAFSNPLMIPTEKAGQYNRPLPEQIVRTLAAGNLKRYESFQSQEVALHHRAQTGKPRSPQFIERADKPLERELGIPEGTITNARPGPPGSIENAIAMALLRKGGYDGAIGVPRTPNDFAEAVRLTSSPPAATEAKPEDDSDTLIIRPIFPGTGPETRLKVPKVTPQLETGVGGGTKYVLPSFATHGLSASSPQDASEATTPAEEEEERPTETLGYDSKRGKVRVRVYSNPNGTFSSSSDGEIRGFSGWMGSPHTEQPTRGAALVDAAAEIRRQVERIAEGRAGSSAAARHVAEAKRILKWVDKHFGATTPSGSPAEPPSGKNEKNELRSAEDAKAAGLSPEIIAQLRTLTVQPEELDAQTPGTTPPAAGEPTIEEQDGRAQTPVRADSGEPLESQLSEGSPAPGESGVARKRSRRGSRAGGGSRTPGSRAGQGPQPDAGAGDPGVGDAADLEHGFENFPPRAGSVSSNRLEHDYRIPDGRIISGSPETRTKNNLAAIRLVRQLGEENRPATLEEKETLAGYVGWGAVPQLFAGNTAEWRAAQTELRNLVSEDEYASAERSTTNAHYTGDLVVDAMWKALEHLGAKPGMSWLEPALGVGTFFGRQPAGLLEGARRIGVEKDELTGKIAKYLYPDSGIEVKAFEDSELPENYFDAAISNVPFGNFGVHDPAYKSKRFLTSSIHNYFFAKALDMVRPGGVVAFVTSRYTMDAYEMPARLFREHIHSKADFLGAVRLPENAFQQSSGTHVITDVIFLRKRLPGAEPAGEAWRAQADKQLQGKYGTNAVPVNEYYHAHPENVLGEEKLKSGQYSANDYTVEGKLTAESLQAALAKALPADAFQAFKRSEKSKRVALTDIDAEHASKLGGLFFDDKGQLFRKTSKGSAEPVPGGAAIKERIRGQLKIRDILMQLMDAERGDQPEQVLNSYRQALNRAYDGFVKRHGPLSTRSNISALLGDPDAPLLTAIERRYDEKAKTAQKAPIFERRIFQPQRKPEAAANAKEALYIALNETGTIAWDRMAELTSRTPESLQKEMEDAGLVYVDPLSRGWQLAEEYLSGSVRSKLKEARKLAKVEPQFESNVKALEGVQPEDIPPSKISAVPGVTWVPTEIYGQFAAHILNASNPPRVHYIAGEWHFEAPRSHAASKWTTSRVGAYELLKDTMNLRRTKVYDRDRDSVTLNKDATLAAREKQKQLSDYFGQWLFSEAGRADEITRIYNDQVNDLRLRTFDGSHLTIPEMSRAVLRTGDLEPYQKAAVWRQIVQRNVLLAHAVGSGKTFDMIAAAMELQRLGQIKRPMFVVPNSTLTGWQQQWAALYPQKRVLVFTERDLEKKKRQRIMAQIATGEWDAVVVPHSSFQFIPVGDAIFNEHFDRLAAQLQESIDAAQEAGMDTRMVKRLQKQRETILANLKDKRNEERQDKTVTWEQMGIDQLYVDEAHEYKKLGFSTKQGTVAGIDPNGNQKTFDLRMKVHYTQQHGRGVTFATGTPVTNTMGELYNVMQYLIQPELDARGIGRFDEWAATFGRIKDVFEPKPEGGGYKTTPRFSKFVNVPDLAQLFRSFADVLTSDMLDIPRPTLFGGERRAIMNDLSPAQLDVMKHLQARAGRIRSNARAALPDNMAALYTDAQKLALDVRTMNAGAPDDPNSRVNQAADEIVRLWRESAETRGTQFIFADFGKPRSAGGQTFSVYDDLIQKLIERGIPANEIQHVYVAKTKLQKAKLFQDVNDGKIRVLLGSTGKMGTGVNMQERGYGEHHLTLPHRPADLEQREGRLVRQGNIHPQVHIIYYGTRGSLDELKFANVSRKARSFAQFMQGKSTLREMEDVDDMAPSLEQFQAQVSGDPRVMRKLEVDNELNRLTVLHSEFRDEQWKYRRELNQVPLRIKGAENQIELYRKIAATREKTGRVWVIGKEKFEGEGNQNKVAAALEKQLVKIIQTGTKGEVYPLGSAYGVPLKGGLEHRFSSGPATFVEVGDNTVLQESPDKALGAVMSINHYVTKVDARIPEEEARIAQARADEKTLTEALETPFANQSEYDKLLTEQQELFEALGGNKSDAGAMAAGDDEVADESVEADERGDEEDDLDEEEPGAEASDEETPVDLHYDWPKEAPAEQKKDDDSGVVLGAGLGAIQPYIDKFLKNDVIPSAKQVAEVFKLVKSDLVKVLAPAAVAGAQPTALSTRQRASELARSTDRAEAALRVASKYFEAQPAQANFDFIDRIEQGLKQPSPDLQAIADLIRPMLDGRRDEIQNLGTGKLKNWIEDYFPHLWKDPKAASQAFQNYAKAPMEGSKAFLKKRTVDSIAYGIQVLHLEPFSTNPVDFVLAKVREMDKYLMAHRILDDMRANAQLKFNRATRPLPDGWKKIDDNVATVWGTPSHEGAMQIEGYWIAPEPAARVLNNYLSPGLRDKSGIVRSFMSVSNVLNQAQLGFSGFHAVFTALEAVTSHLALGIYQGAHGDVVQAVKSIALSPAAPFTTFFRGDKMLKEWYSAGSQGALIGELVDAAVQAGGRAHMESFYRTHIGARMVKAWKEGDVFGAAWRVPFAAFEIPTRIIMEGLVPRLKMGAFADMAQYEIEKLGTNATDPDIQAALAKAWDSIDNRFGQLVYDNLFWSKYTKDIAMLLVRSPGWNVGDIRELLGGYGDTAKFAGAAGRGKRPEFTHRMAYIPAHLIVAATVGALLYYFWHGHAPHKLKDYFFPVDDHHKRWSPATYVKDEYHWTHDPVGTAHGKMNPLLAFALEVLSNRDYFGRKIVNTHHPWPREVKELAEYVGKHFEPLWLQQLQDKKLSHRTLDEKILPEFGITRAPKSLDHPSHR